MLLKNTPKSSFYAKKRNPNAKRSGTLLLVSLAIYTSILAAAGILLFTKMVPWNIKQIFITEVWDKMAIEKTPINYLKGMSADYEKLIVEIKHKNVQKLAYVRAASLEKGTLVETVENSVGAIIRHNDQAYRVELQLKGRLKDHWENEDMMSFKVKVKDGRTIMGMKNFDLQHPKTRDYITEWLRHQLFIYAGLIGLRYDFVAVDINGKGSRIYALEESFEKRLIESNQLKEGPLFKFNRDFYWDGGDAGEMNEHGLAQDLWGSDIAPTPKKQVLADPTQLLLFNKAKTLVESFRQNQLTTSEVFDVPKLATFFALNELFGTAHPSKLDNVRFYYNPITSLVEPVIHDGWKFYLLSERGRDPKGVIPNGLVGTERQLGREILLNKPVSWKEEPWYDIIFKDPVFYRAYVEALEKISKPTFLDLFFEQHNDQLRKYRKILYHDYPLFRFDPSPVLYENQKYIRKILEPEQMIHVYCHHASDSSAELQLEMTNCLTFPVEIHAVYLGDSTKLTPIREFEIIQANKQLTPSTIYTLKVQLPPGLIWNKALIADLKVVSSIVGSHRIIETPVFAQELIEDDLLTQGLTNQVANLEKFDCFTVDDQVKIIRFKTGLVQLTEKLIIPPGYRVMAKGGTKIILANGASILSYSPLYLSGQEKNPIVISATGTNAQGLIVMNAKGESRLQHVYFSELSSPGNKEQYLSGTVTFYNSPVCIFDCLFENNLGGQEYVHIIRSKFTIYNTVFANADANALASDFSTGSIINTRFINSGKNAINIRGSKIMGNEIWIDKVGDKGVNATEQSTLEAQSIKISEADMAVASVDLSAVLIDNVVIRDSRIAFAAFQEKTNFGPATIEIRRNFTITGKNEIPYFIESGSEMKIQFEPIASSVAFN